MVRPILRHAVFVLLLAALLAPVMESFDSWDATPALANDTEFNVAALALVAGLFAAVAWVAVRSGNVPLFATYIRLPIPGKVFCGAKLLPFFPGCSPPGIPLRV